MTVPDSSPAVPATPIAAPQVSEKGPGHTLSKRRTVTPSPRITRRNPIKDLTTVTSAAAASPALGRGCPVVPMPSKDPSGLSCGGAQPRKLRRGGGQSARQQRLERSSAAEAFDRTPNLFEDTKPRQFLAGMQSRKVCRSRGANGEVLNQRPKGRIAELSEFNERGRCHRIDNRGVQESSTSVQDVWLRPSSTR